MSFFEFLGRTAQDVGGAADQVGQGLARGAHELLGQQLGPVAAGAGQAIAGAAAHWHQEAQKAAPGLLQAAHEHGHAVAQGAGEFGHGVVVHHLAPAAEAAAREILAAIEASAGHLEQLRHHGALVAVAGAGAGAGCKDADCVHALRHGLEAAIAQGGGEGGGEKNGGGGGSSGSGLAVYLDRVSGSVRGFVDEHPVLATVMVTLLALAIIGLVAPWLLAAIGFSSEGPVAGSWAAEWQSSIGLVEAGSLFALLQSFSMTL